MLSSKDPHWRHLTAGSLPSLAPDPQNGIVLGKCLVLPAATSTESLKLQPGHWGNGRFVTCILWYLMVSHDLMESRSLFGRIEHLGCPAPLRWDSGSPLGRLWDHSHAVLHKSWGAQWSQWRLLWSIGNSWQLMSITLEFQKTMIKTSAKLWTSVGPKTDRPGQLPLDQLQPPGNPNIWKSPWNRQAVAIAISEVSVSPRSNCGCSVSTHLTSCN